MLDVVHALDSKILSHELSNFTKTLARWLPKTGDWKACWRASRDDWAASTFHTNCDGKIPTLVIVKVVKNSKILIFGGYCTVTWAGGMLEFIIIYIQPFQKRLLLQTFNSKP